MGHALPHSLQDLAHANDKALESSHELLDESTTFQVVLTCKQQYQLSSQFQRDHHTLELNLDAHSRFLTFYKSME